MIDKEKNWEEYKKALLDTGREGVKELVEYLENKTDMKTAPASAKYHLSVEGGLVQHSLNVKKYIEEIHKEMGLTISPTTLTLVSLLHDICKTNFYVMGWEWDKEYKEKTNQWRKLDVWKVEDQLPLGHGEKSVIIVSRFMPLKIEEMLAIRYHMLCSEGGMLSYPANQAYKGALDKTVLIKLIAIADQMAELYESTRSIVEAQEK